jgi:hypothetical protein
MIMKLKFFTLIESRDPTSNIFYFDFFQKIVKETKGNYSNRKNEIFIKFLNNQSALDRINVITYFENKFMFLFTSEFSNFLFNPDIQTIRSRVSSDTFVSQNDSQPRRDIVNNAEDDCNREREIKDFSIISTQEELSDDEFLPNAPCYVETTNSDHSHVLIPSKFILI